MFRISPRQNYLYFKTIVLISEIQLLFKNDSIGANILPPKFGKIPIKTYNDFNNEKNQRTLVTKTMISNAKLLKIL